MAKPKIGVVIHTPLRRELFSDSDWARLGELGDVVATESEKPVSADEAVAILRDCEVAVGSWGTPRPDAEVMPACPGLRMWEHVAGSVRHFFGDHLEGRDLTIGSCAPAIAECVAEMCVGELITGLKRVFENSAANRAERVRRPANSTVGVVAASWVGRHLMRMLGPFGPRVLLYDPFVTPERARELGAELVTDLAELCRRSDAITLHTPALPATEKIMGPTELEAMKDDCVFVNTSRGACVDEAALVEELAKGRLFAFLDVTDPEPPADDSPLRTLPNVVLTSHIAGGRDVRLGRQAVSDIEAFLSGGEPVLRVTEDMLDRIA
ncbi:MAG: hydroxyacid dehydrogenase [Planctomycetota bacterium]|jgi:phosphoglycerate dehydrogenase-like enzyme